MRVETNTLSSGSTSRRRESDSIILQVGKVSRVVDPNTGNGRTIASQNVKEVLESEKRKDTQNFSYLYNPFSNPIILSLV